MKPFVVVCLCLLGFPLSSAAQDCDRNTGNNASVFISLIALDEVQADEHIYAFADNGCVGQTDIVPLENAQALAMTVWGDDELTPEKDGLGPNEPIVVGRFQPSEVATLDMSVPYRQTLTYVPNALYHIYELAFDTTTTQLLDSINLELARLETELDSLFEADSIAFAILEDSLAAQAATITSQRQQIDALEDANQNLQAQVDAQAVAISTLQTDLATQTARADSLQAVINESPDVAELQQQLADANARIAELENEIALTNAQLVGVLEVLRDIIEVVNQQPNRYKQIADILSPGSGP